jgi:guanylate kinase
MIGPLSPDSAQALRGGLVVLSGPSGSGKTSICRTLLEDPRVVLSISATTRPIRKGETDGVEYHFYSKERFLKLRDEGGFVEWAEVYHNYYGTPKAPLVEALGWKDRVLLLDIDVQGAQQLRSQHFQALYLFIAPPSMEALRQRLTARSSDSPEVIEKRLAFARGEMDRKGLYDFVIVNDDLDRAIAEVRRHIGLD